MTREERTANILARFRNLPGEFYMLKGLLVLPSATCPKADGEGRMGWEERRKEEHRINDLYDSMAIARRMDELNGIDVSE